MWIGAINFQICNLGRINKKNYTENHHVAMWVRTKIGTSKVNYDASIRMNGFIGIGYVVRDNKVRVIRSGVNRF